LTPQKNFVLKLREHLLPQIQTALRQDAEFLPEHPSIKIGSNSESFHIGGNASHFVLFDQDRLYHHKLIRFHFTTYNVHRGTNIINPGTSRCNVMFLADDTANLTDHHFLYAHVIGMYHANVIYTRPGMSDFKAHRFDVLWVRWFGPANPASSGWSSSTLDLVCFPPMN
jgi:hypothetical protein